MLLRVLNEGGYHLSSKAIYRCDHCQTEFEREYRQAQRLRLTHFCNKNCAARGRQRPKRVPKTCKACDQTFMGLALSIYCRQCFRIRNTCRDKGITRQQRHQMVVAQDGACAICHSTSRKLVIDHDHSTDVVRGLLCRHCNSVLGMVERPVWLKAALEYLQQTKSHET